MSGWLVGLDLSTSVGFARLRRSRPARPPTFGTLSLTGDTTHKLGEFMDWLLNYHRVVGFDALAWEEPILKPTDRVANLKLFMGLAGIAAGFAGMKKMPWLEVGVQQVKITLTGNHRADKLDMVAAAQKTMNWEVATDHEADAGAVGVYAYEVLFP